MVTYTYLKPSYHPTYLPTYLSDSSDCWDCSDSNESSYSSDKNAVTKWNLHTFLSNSSDSSDSSDRSATYLPDYLPWSVVYLWEKLPWTHPSVINVSICLTEKCHTSFVTRKRWQKNGDNKILKQKCHWWMCKLVPFFVTIFFATKFFWHFSVKTNRHIDNRGMCSRQLFAILAMFNNGTTTSSFMTMSLSWNALPQTYCLIQSTSLLCPDQEIPNKTCFVFVYINF